MCMQSGELEVYMYMYVHAGTCIVYMYTLCVRYGKPETASYYYYYVAAHTQRHAVRTCKIYPYLDLDSRNS